MNNPFASIPRDLRDPAVHFAQMRIDALEADNRRLRAALKLAEAINVQLAEERDRAEARVPGQRKGRAW